VAEALAGTVDRIGTLHAGIAEPEVVPKIESRPVRWIEDFLAVVRQERVWEDDGRLLFAMAVPKAQPP